MQTRPTSSDSRVLLTGASGYVGGRLLRSLEALGHRVRCFARTPRNLTSRISDRSEVVQGDVVSGEGLREALAGIDTAYYLIHSMGSSGGFEEEDRRGARNFAEAARAAGVRRIIYLGGLADESQALSPHLRSRVEVGRILRESGIPTVELRASIVIGSGSLSFEMIRSLVGHLPIMITPRWVSTPAQPVAISDLLEYLVQSLDIPDDACGVYEIGGADRTSYAGLMREFARQRGLSRIMLRVPVLTPRLSSLWLGLVTPVYARVGRKLIESIEHPTVVQNAAADRVFDVRPIKVAEAIARALREEEDEAAPTRWSDSRAATGAGEHSFGGESGGRRFVDSRTTQVAANPQRAFAPIARIGGDTGWYAMDWLWQLRGAIDLLIGGVGMRRARRSPSELAIGDIVDCWRVGAFEPDRFVRFEAEMRLPGRAWLEFEVAPTEDGRKSQIRQTAIFEPQGFFGLAYWYAVYPLHSLIFAGMLREIANSVAPPDGPILEQAAVGTSW